MKAVPAMADQLGETNGLSYYPSKISPVLNYIVSTAVLAQYPSRGNPVASNGGFRLSLLFLPLTADWWGGGGEPLACTSLQTSL